ncbi:hypothetical protein RFI_01087 [Reticulomyxa filosa]|uniref:Uncharacterized protein n=1 Tax=Reticulomyxa filosa TaxID=46433 RepID=X6PBU7_RETFI|nr:hypothetical protein RFI_01087 [Reticulomyxa filosa]|eukprot:ETO35975.1 hypothetical protein RFI_01087 [Reticulomyxa filosa]
MLSKSINSKTCSKSLKLKIHYFYLFLSFFKQFELICCFFLSKLQELEYAKATSGTDGEPGDGTTNEEENEDMYKKVEVNTAALPGEQANSNESNQNGEELISAETDGPAGTVPSNNVELRSLNALTDKKRKQTARWKPEDFENMDIETLARILEASAEVKTETEAQQTGDPNPSEEMLVSVEQKYLATSALRRKIMDKQYSWWHWCKHAAWVFTIAWTLICAVVTLIFVVRFDMLRDAQNSYKSPQESTQCPASLVDISDQNSTQYSASEKAMSDYLQHVSASTLDSKQGFAFRQSVSRWLMSIFIGFLLSLFVWQPLFDLILQIIKVARFDSEEVNESYFFSNTKLLLTQAERDALLQAGANIGADDDADRESDGGDDADSQQRDNAEPVQPQSNEPQNNQQQEQQVPQNVLDELDRQMSIEMLRSQIEFLAFCFEIKNKKYFF